MIAAALTASDGGAAVPVPRWRPASFEIDDGEGSRLVVEGHVGFAFGLCLSPYGFWCPVHLPLACGICPGVEFPDLDRAKAFCAAIIPLVEDWTMIRAPIAGAEGDRLRAAVIATARAHGAVTPLYAESERKAS